jgi:hypothetical protein
MPLTGLGRYTVDAAAKALELLSAFSFHERRLSLGELAARTGIPRATAFRLLSTLEAARFVTKAGGEYQLGLKCFMLGNIVAADLDLREIARPHLVALRDATRETTQIAILDHWPVVYLERVPSPHPVGFMRARTGRHPARLLHRARKDAARVRADRKRRHLGRHAGVRSAHAAHDHLGPSTAERAARHARARLRPR